MSIKISMDSVLFWKNEKGEVHREKGPAFIRTDGYLEYRFNDVTHRLDGPAVIWPDGSKYYYLYGEEYKKEEYWAKVKEL